MKALRVHIPILLGFLGGMFFLVQFFMPHKAIQATYEELNIWLRIIAAFGIILGIASLMSRHLSKIRRRQQDWQYSILTVVSFVFVCVVGIWKGKDPGTAFSWSFQNMLVPLDATMFALLAFFMASAAYRTFRARTPEATILLVAAVVVMLGRVPIGEMMYHKLPAVTEWLMSVPAVASKRAIIFGSALGGIATSLRIILGIERSHIGG
jgi:positive regulator of sigma E activity